MFVRYNFTVTVHLRVGGVRAHEYVNRNCWASSFFFLSHRVYCVQAVSTFHAFNHSDIIHNSTKWTLLSSIFYRQWSRNLNFPSTDFFIVPNTCRLPLESFPIGRLCVWAWLCDLLYSSTKSKKWCVISKAAGINMSLLSLPYEQPLLYHPGAQNKDDMQQKWAGPCGQIGGQKIGLCFDHNLGVIFYLSIT